MRPTQFLAATPQEAAMRPTLLLAAVLFAALCWTAIGMVVCSL